MMLSFIFVYSMPAFADSHISRSFLSVYGRKQQETMTYIFENHELLSMQSSKKWVKGQVETDEARPPTVPKGNLPAIYIQEIHLKTETTHVELGNLDVLFRTLDQTSQPSLTR